METNKRPLIGLGVFVRRDGKILLGKRKGSIGSHTWALPGGHLEFGESFAECAIRETLEETGVTVVPRGLGYVVNNYFETEEKHYVTLFIMADYVSGDATCREPEKCDEWHWLSLEEFPPVLFAPLKQALAEGLDPFDGPLLSA